MSFSDASNGVANRPLSIASHEVEGVCAEWRGSLVEAIDRLRRLEQSTETDFLKIGGTLQEFSLRSQKASEQAHNIAAHLSLANLKKVEEELFGLLDRLGKHLEERELQGTVKMENLEGIAEDAVKILRPLTDLDRNRRILRMMGLYVRIENARLGRADASFEDVANVAEQLADTIKERVTSISGNMSDLYHSAEQLRQQLADVDREAAQRKDLVFTQSRECLESLQRSSVQAEEQCGRFAAGVSKRSGDISRGIVGVVMSMQFHDITRQQIEHVRLSLSELERLLPSDARAPSSAETFQEAVESAATLGDLHVAQVTHAREVLVKAVTDIQAHLSEVRGGLGAILEETQTLAENARSVTTALADDLSRLSDPLGGFFQAQAQTTRTMGDALGKIDRILGGVTLDIEQIGVEIKMIAVNSLVKTSRMGAEGMALRVLAESIKNLSDEVCERTALVGKPLEGISSRAMAIGRVVALEGSVGEQELEEMNLLLCGRRKRFTEMAADVVALSGEMRTALERLVSDIDQAISTFRIDASLHEEFEGVISRIDTVRESARKIVPWARIETVGEKTAAKLKAEAARYTMDSERDIHHRVFRNEGPVGGVAEPTSELPDGFEFFGAPVSDSSAIVPRDEGEHGDDQQAQAPGNGCLGDGIELFDPPASPQENASQGPTPPVTSGEKKEEDFGDNVELF